MPTLMRSQTGISDLHPDAFAVVFSVRRSVLMLLRCLQSNFFTLSSFGVTHFLNGKPEFSELEQWKREVFLVVALQTAFDTKMKKKQLMLIFLSIGFRQHYLFNAIVKIPVFRQYRTWKTYKVWRDSVRYGKMVTPIPSSPEFFYKSELQRCSVYYICVCVCVCVHIYIYMYIVAWGTRGC